MSDINCPYCDAELEINHDDGRGYEQNLLHEQECDICNKFFTFSTYISFSYNAYKADCLNNENHIWKPQPTAPKAFTKMCCETCEEKREPTEEERIKYDLGSKEEFYKSLKS